MAYQCTLAFHWHFLFGSGCNCSFFEAQSQISEKQLASPQRVLVISKKSEVLLQIENLFLPIIHTQTHRHAHTHQLKLALNQFRVKLCELASSCDLKIISSHLTFKHRIKSHLKIAGIIRNSPYSPNFQDKG